MEADRFISSPFESTYQMNVNLVNDGKLLYIDKNTQRSYCFKCARLMLHKGEGININERKL